MEILITLIVIVIFGYAIFSDFGVRGWEDSLSGRGKEDGNQEED